MRNFSKGYYVHDKFMDVAIEILKVQYQDSKRAKLKVAWWNRGWVGQPFILYHRDSLEIKKEDMHNWTKIFTLERYVRPEN